VPRLTVADLPRRSVMGIVNVTPDSFSDGGRYLDTDAAVARGAQLAQSGAAVIDVGGESTRPGAEPVEVGEELRRVVPVVRELADRGLRVSIDTTKAEVAAAALESGALMVNDVSGGSADAEMLRVVSESEAAFVAMHMRGTPRTMQAAAVYDDVVAEVAAELGARVAAALAAGIDPGAVFADPGIGFAKTAEHNCALLRALPDLAARVGVPLVVGASRKSFLRAIAGEDGRDDATLATTVWSFEHGAAMVRVHDVEASVRAARFLEALDRAVA
jgi:dihydropteroate synthase